MFLKNLFRILIDYKFHLITVIFFELLYILKGYRGNRFNFVKNEYMTDDIPCPYYFLIKIKKNLKKNNFNKLLDLGSGSGRVIEFFNKNFSNKNFMGVEYFSNQYDYSRKIFKEEKNIKIIKADFTKMDFFQYDSDCYFFNDPFKNSSEFIEFMEKTTNFYLNKKNVLFIFVNFNKKIIENLENIRCIESHYISEKKGYSIYCLNK